MQQALLTLGTPEDVKSRRPTAEAGNTAHDELKDAVANFKQFDFGLTTPAKTLGDSNGSTTPPLATATTLPPVQEPIKQRAPHGKPLKAFGNEHTLPVLDAAWTELKWKMDNYGCADQHGCIGAAAGHAKEARVEAASKVLGNHKNLLQDICNPSDTTNIDGKPLTQRELVRVGAEYAAHVDEGLRETCRRLLGLEEPRVLHGAKEAIEARAACARYLVFRIQAHADQKPGRKPDMSPEAFAAFSAVLAEVGGTAWEPLYTLYKDVQINGVAVDSAGTGAARHHVSAARLEAAGKILSNHFRLLIDVCNPSESTNAMGIELGLTQHELRRVSPDHAPHVDEGLREVTRRLLGLGISTGLAVSHEAVEARAACARYLAQRTQSAPDQKPGRSPDMSPAAAAAMRAVLVEVGSTAWEPLQVLFTARGVCESSTFMSVAANHPPAARLEAVTRLLGNHFNLLLDVCNPKSAENIDGKPLTQVQLTRVHPDHSPHIDEMLREVAHRLMGFGEPKLVSAAPAAVQARVTCAHYLDERIQERPEQMKGRKPDMGLEAAKAMKDVLLEVATKSCTPALSRALTGANGPLGGMATNALATELEKMAQQLKLSGETTPRQLSDVQAQLDIMGQRQRGEDISKKSVKEPPKSSLCLIM